MSRKRSRDVSGHDPPVPVVNGTSKIQKVEEILVGKEDVTQPPVSAPARKVETTRTRCCYLSKKSTVSRSLEGVDMRNLDPERLRVRLDNEVSEVSRAMIYGSQFLELYLRQVLTSGGGRMPPDFDWEVAVRLSFTGMQTNANPRDATLVKCPGFKAAMETWQSIWPRELHGVKLVCPNSLMYEYQAYWSTLLCNYTKIALAAHVYWTARYVLPEHRPLLKKILIHRKGTAEEVATLPLVIQHLVQECWEIQDAEFSNATASRAAELRWACILILSEEPASKTIMTNGRARLIHPKLPAMTPHCKKAARFIRLDMQYARGAMGLPRLSKEEREAALKSTDVLTRQLASHLQLLFENAPRREAVREIDRGQV